MEAMRLGTLPIVAPTGGLKDTVEAVFFLDEKDWGVGGETTLTQPWKIRWLMAFARNTRDFPWLCYYLSVPWGTWICLSWVLVF